MLYNPPSSMLCFFFASMRHVSVCPSTHSYSTTVRLLVVLKGGLLPYTIKLYSASTLAALGLLLEATAFSRQQSLETSTPIDRMEKMKVTGFPRSTTMDAYVAGRSRLTLPSKATLPRSASEREWIDRMYGTQKQDLTDIGNL